MQQTLPLVDMEFGIAQLSGNRALFVKLLEKFKSEYKDMRGELKIQFAEQEYATFKQSIHTVKGVAGNLGVKALHMRCKLIEEKLASGQKPDAEFQAFIETLEQTFEFIDSLSAAAAQQNKATAISSPQDTLEELVTRLNDNEYIPPDELDLLLAKIDLASDKQTQISQAINDLDYAQALTLLQAD